MIDKTAQVNVTPAQRVTNESLESLLGEVAGDFFDRMTSGQRPQIEDYVARYPEIAAQIRSAFPALQLVGDSHAESKLQQADIDITSQKTLGDFRILHELGRGGMGVVYEAEQLSMGRKVALKVLPFAALAQEKSLQRFRNEVRAAGALNHQNIVPIYSVGEERGVHFFAMQLIRGQSMAEVIAQLVNLKSEGHSLQADSITEILSPNERPQVGGGSDEPTRMFTSEGNDDLGASSRISPAAAPETQARISTQGRTESRSTFVRAAARLGVQAAEALQHAHDQGVLHRDIKPGNLMLDAEGRLYIADFGLAHIETDVGVTMTGDLVGTLRYMSPEQALAKRIVIDHRSDIYSLGATLYELLTLRPLFDGANRQELLKQIAFEEPRKPRRIDPKIPSELETIVLKAVERNPEDRYATADDLAADLQAFLEHRPITAKPPTIVHRLKKWSRRHPAWVASAVCVLLLLCIGLGLSNFLIAQQRDRADQAAENEQTQRIEAERQKELAHASYRRAREAVEQYLTKVSEDVLLEQPSMQPLRKDLLELALTYYQRFVDERADDPVAVADLGNAYYHMGKITRQIGSKEKALELFLKAVELRSKLVEENPDQDDFRNDLALAYYQLGWLQISTGRLVESETSIKECLSVSEKLVAQDPTKFDYQKTLALAYDLQATTEARKGKFDLAVEFARKAVNALLKLEKIGPVDAKTRASLGTIYSNLGAHQVNAGKHNDGIDSFYSSRDILVELLRETPVANSYRFQLGSTYINLATSFSSIGKRKEAADFSRKALQVQEMLVAENPTVHAYRSDLAITYQQLAEELSDGGESSEATDMFGKAVDLMEELVAHNPTDTEYQSTLAQAYGNLSHTQFLARQFADATASARGMVRVAKQLVADNPDQPDYLNVLAQGYDRLSNMNAYQGNVDESKRALKQAQEIRKKLVERYPEVARFAIELGWGHYRIASTHGNLDEAMAECEQAREVIAKLVDSKSEVPLYRFRLAQVYNLRGVLQQRQRELDSALASYDEAIKLYTKLVSDNPDLRDYQSNLADAHSNRANVLFYQANADVALEALQRVIEIQTKLEADSPGAFAADLGQSYFNLSLMQQQSGKLNDSLASLQKARTIAEKLVAEHPTIVTYLTLLSSVYNSLGSIQADKWQWDEAQTSYYKALEARERLASQNPGLAAYALPVGGSYCNMGILLRKRGEVERSLEWFSKAEATLKAVLRENTQHGTARQFLRNTHEERAITLTELGRFDEALADWNKAMELDSGRGRDELAMRRAWTQARGGDAGAAIASADLLLQKENLSNDTLFVAARIFSFLSTEDDAPAEYATRAVQLLRQAHKSDYFANPTKLLDLKREKDLEPIRTQKDFRSLLDELQLAD